MLLLGRDHRDLGLVWLLSPLSQAASGRFADSWVLPGHCIGRNLSAPGSSPLLAEISPCLVPNSLGVQEARLCFDSLFSFQRLQ